MSSFAADADRRRASQTWLRQQRLKKESGVMARQSFSLFNGGDLQGPISIHPMRHFGIWPNGMSDGIADMTNDPVDLFGQQKR